MNISKKTQLRVADNSGIDIVECIGIKGGLKKCKAGHKIRVCVKKLSRTDKRSSDTRKFWKERLLAMVVRTVGDCAKSDGSVVRFSDNAVVILDDSGNPIGTRVFGDVSDKVKHAKIISMASGVK